MCKWLVHLLTLLSIVSLAGEHLILSTSPAAPSSKEFTIKSLDRTTNRYTSE